MAEARWLTRASHDRRLRIGLVILGLLALGALLAPWISPYDPAGQPDPVGLKLRAPSFAHPTGHRSVQPRCAQPAPCRERRVTRHCARCDRHRPAARHVVGCARRMAWRADRRRDDAPRGCGPRTSARAPPDPRARLVGLAHARQPRAGARAHGMVRDEPPRARRGSICTANSRTCSRRARLARPSGASFEYMSSPGRWAPRSSPRRSARRTCSSSKRASP